MPFGSEFPPCYDSSYISKALRGFKDRPFLNKKTQQLQNYGCRAPPWKDIQASDDADKCPVGFWNEPRCQCESFGAQSTWKLCPHGLYKIVSCRLWAASDTSFFGGKTSARGNRTPWFYYLVLTLVFAVVGHQVRELLHFARLPGLCLDVKMTFLSQEWDHQKEEIPMGPSNMGV